MQLELNFTGNQSGQEHQRQVLEGYGFPLAVFQLRGIYQLCLQGKALMKTEDFPPIPTVSQSTASNQSWVVVTTTKTDSDGSRSQTTAIAAKPR